MLTRCIIVDPPDPTYTAAMVNKSGQKVTVKSVHFNSTIPDFLILAPNDSVSWNCYEMTIARTMEVYFNDILFKSFDTYEDDRRDPRELFNYKKNEDGIYVYTFTPQDYEQFLNMDKQNQRP